MIYEFTTRAENDPFGNLATEVIRDARPPGRNKDTHVLRFSYSKSALSALSAATFLLAQTGYRRTRVNLI